MQRLTLSLMAHHTASGSAVSISGTIFVISRFIFNINAQFDDNVVQASTVLPRLLFIYGAVKGTSSPSSPLDFLTAFGILCQFKK